MKPALCPLKACKTVVCASGVYHFINSVSCHPASRRALSHNKYMRLPDSAAPQLQRWGAQASRRPESASGAVYKLSKSSTFRNEVLASRKNGVISKFNLDGIIQKSTFQMINERTGSSRLVGDFIEHSQHSSLPRQQRVLRQQQEQLSEQQQQQEEEGEGEEEAGGRETEREAPLTPFDHAAPPHQDRDRGQEQGADADAGPSRRVAGRGGTLAMLSLAAEQLWVRARFLFLPDYSLSPPNLT